MLLYKLHHDRVHIRRVAEAQRHVYSIDRPILPVTHMSQWWERNES